MSGRTVDKERTRDRRRSRSSSQDRGRDRPREHKRRHRSTSRDRRHARSTSRERREARSRSRERKRSRSADRKDSTIANVRSKGSGEDAEQEKKRKRLDKLAAWRSKTAGEPVQQAFHAGEVKEEPAVKAEASQAWMPWEDPATAFTGAIPKPLPKATAVPAAPVSASMKEEDDVDPLDAFMAAEINPEVAAKEREEAQRREDERLQKAQQRAEGKIPKLAAILEDSDDEEQPDVEIQIPEHKVKLVVGPGGEKIKFIQKKSKCRLQIKKEDDELNKGFGLGPKSYALPKARQVGDPVKLTTIMLFGNNKECDIAQRMIEEAIENKEQKQKQRQRDYDRKRDTKLRERQLYHLRHTHDYEALELPLGASKADAKAAYRRLAKIWHPDKHPNNQEEAKEKFQAIQKAFDSLMSTDEDTRVEALAH